MGSKMMLNCIFEFLITLLSHGSTLSDTPNLPATILIYKARAHSNINILLNDPHASIHLLWYIKIG